MIKALKILDSGLEKRKAEERDSKMPIESYLECKKKTASLKDKIKKNTESKAIKEIYSYYLYKTIIQSLFTFSLLVFISFVFYNISVFYPDNMALTYHNVKAYFGSSATVYHFSYNVVFFISIVFSFSSWFYSKHYLDKISVQKDYESEIFFNLFFCIILTGIFLAGLGGLHIIYLFSISFLLIYEICCLINDFFNLRKKSYLKEKFNKNEILKIPELEHELDSVIKRSESLVRNILNSEHLMTKVYSIFQSSDSNSTERRVTKFLLDKFEEEENHKKRMTNQQLKENEKYGNMLKKHNISNKEYEIKNY